MSRLVLVVGIVGVCCSSAPAQVIGRVSVSSTGDQGNGTSGGHSISADGRFVAFGSWASNLVTGDTNGAVDIFVHDRETGETTRVSVSSAKDQGNGNSSDASISADGRFVAFASDASNLVGGDTNARRDVFVHDRQTGETSRASVSGGLPANSESNAPAISADGRFVAFESYASNLVDEDTNRSQDVFVHDRQTGRTTRVSVSSRDKQGNRLSRRPSISADGRFVAFDSEASNLVGGDTNARRDVFVHDRQTGRTTRVSVSASGYEGNEGSSSPSISADGRFVTFGSHATNLVTGDTNGAADIFVHDRQTGETSRVSVTSGGHQANSSSWTGSISADGRFVAFGSWASNLIGGDTNGVDDVYVHDRQTDRTSRVSVSTGGQQGNGESWSRSISADGRFVTFDSNASNLVPWDTNGVLDAFVATTDPGFAPVLSWPGELASESDGVDPDVGTPGQTLFRYRVKLTDPDDDEPDYVRVIIRKDGVKYFNRKMRPVRGSGATIAGRVYNFSLREPLPPGTYQYRFRARDDDGFASGPPTEWQCGPSTLPELLFGTAPGLEDGVRPNTGTADDTVFFWKVIHWDGDGDPAKFVRVVLWRDGSFHNVFWMKSKDPSPDPKAGVVYRARRRLPAGSYEYRFEAEDKDGRAVGPASVKMSGLTVTSGGASALTSLSAVRTNAGAQITFSLSSAAEVQARILNIAGRPVKTLCQARECDAGTNTLLWNAQSDQGLAVPNGTYLVEVTAKASDGSQARGVARVRLAR